MGVREVICPFDQRDPQRLQRVNLPAHCTKRCLCFPGKLQRLQDPEQPQRMHRRVEEESAQGSAESAAEPSLILTGKEEDIPF